jgi:hypothetical protein
MSAGAVFKLIANDGKADRLIMATKLLNQRIRDVMCARRRAGKHDNTPTLVDLERTHILYVNAHFKPFAAIGYEYNKVRPQTGTTTLDGGVTFSIPQFGDFFHDMVCRTRLSQFRAVAGTTPIQVSGSPGSPSSFPADGENADGTASADSQYRIVDSAGNAVAGGAVYANYVRYCEYPGNRLFKLVKFDVNGNPLDQYDTMIPTMLEKFCVAPNKRTGHDRLVGQEVPMVGYGGLCNGLVSDANSDNTPAGVISKATSNQSNQTVGLFEASLEDSLSLVGQTAVAALGSSKPQFDVSRKLHQIVNGPQTPKPVQAPLEIWNKLRFWFNDDVRLSIASVSIPFGQRYISIDFNKQDMLAFEFPSIYLEKTVKTADTSTKSYSPIFNKNGMTDITIEKMELYINNIFVNPEIHDIFIKRIGFSLIRVYRQHTQHTSALNGDETLLSQLKWPIEYIFVGLRPCWNIKSANENQWRDWHRMTRMLDVGCDGASKASVPGAEDGTFESSVGQVMPDNYYLSVPTVDSMSLTSHGIVIFDGFSDTFFNQYLPFHYGGQALSTPDDLGALFVNLSLFPRSYQPSGHLNISRARETYLKWTSSYVSNTSPADLLAVAVAINFLLITEGSAVLRYST